MGSDATALDEFGAWSPRVCRLSERDGAIRNAIVSVCNYQYSILMSYAKQWKLDDEASHRSLFGTQRSAPFRVVELQIDLRILAGISAIMNQVQMKRGYGHPSDDLLE